MSSVDYVLVLESSNGLRSKGKKQAKNKRVDNSL